MTAPNTTTEGATYGVLNADRLLLAVVLAVATRREGTKRKHRAGTLLEDCLSVLGNPAFCPNLYRFRAPSVDQNEAERLKMLGEAHAVMERIVPLARAVAEFDA